ncbi:hypothetical protein FRX31_017407 [Thalictrum thalictroides]|uniref:Neprosin PEP catalytic domain-containing protein n=1 Tax=Thalictrum thalictroides TaxID=46969 RepID=A0A7J6W6K5_THATH|nr:hypothetical protein FRX31_017407 [Thalictrum thalictroides]
MHKQPAFDHPLLKNHKIQLAIVRSKFRPNVVFKGIAATISVDSPVVKANQSSTAQVWIQNGDPSIVNRLEVGWMVSPALFGDGVPRSFTNWKDYVTLDWWFHDATHNITVGYWPKTLFPLLALGASQVTWGGSTMGQPNGASPEMGSGRFPGGDFRHGCINNMLVVDTKNYWVEPAGVLYY